MKVKTAKFHQDKIGKKLLVYQRYKRNPQKRNSGLLIHIFIFNSISNDLHYSLREALDIYNSFTEDDQINDLHALKACCLNALRKFNEAYIECQLQKPLTLLTNRLFCNLEIQLNPSIQESQFEHNLKNSLFDNICKASLLYHKQRYKEALLSFESCFQQKVEIFSLYAAFCLYKQEYFKYSLQLLQTYLNQHPNSLIGLNLQTCIYYQQQNNKQQCQKNINKMLQIMKQNHISNDVIRHNVIVFEENKCQFDIFKQLMYSLPEAKLNYIILCLQNDKLDEAQIILHTKLPTTNLVKALLASFYLCQASQGQLQNNKYIQRALNLYKEVGNSDSECDTILGRQCLASYYFITRDYEQSFTYLESIELLCQENDTFKWNYAIANFLSSKYLLAENYLSSIQDENIKMQESFYPLMYKLLIYNNKSEYAWLLYLNSEQQFTFDQMIKYLTVLGNTCYSHQAFFISAKAFDRLNSLQINDQQHQYQTAIIGSVAGLFYLVTLKTQTLTNLKEAISIMLKSCRKQNVEKLMNLFKNGVDQIIVSYEIILN